MSDKAVPLRALPIAVVVNGAPRETPAQTLADLIALEGHGDRRVATAVNGHFVPAQDRAGVPLKTGDRIEIVSARQGG